jgi:(Z)-2-((N-methylformamido)methylene)-5-hydroxybutyrolactone dehydrogenase
MALESFQQFINGKFESASDNFESVNPATGDAWALMPKAVEADVDRAVNAAHVAFTTGIWPTLNASARGKLLYKLADLMAADADALAELETKDTGKIRRETRAVILYISEYYRYFAGLADKLQGAHFDVDKPDMEAYTRREPIGVVAAIVPWNSQMFLSAVKLAPALAAGCTVVLKASEDGPAPLLTFAQLIDEAGFPPGVVNIITGMGDTCGKALTSHPLVDRIAFTGGPTTARRIVENSANNLAAVSLELGGKSPVLVFEDADLESAANAIVSGIFAATGQSCVAGSRLLVHSSVHSELMDILVAKAQRIKIGDPQDLETEMGPLATQRQLTHVQDVVDRSVAAGAKLLIGGKVPAGFESGFYYEPTILDCAEPVVACVQEEIFGPVLSVLKFETDAQALAMANDSEYGLASGVFTKDIGRAHRFVRSLRAGIVWVNTYRMISPMVPFGGYGQSGTGREAGAESILDYTRTKSVWINTSEAPISDPFIMR